MHNPVRPKKALGQHFLRDLDIARRIAGTLDDYRGLPVLEIGPGTGVLTQFLLESHTAENVTLAEIDTESVDYLRRELPEPQPRIVEGDFLRMDAAELMPGDGQFCIIGNYPYNISSQIFFRVLDWKDRVVCCSGMLQREVAQRLPTAWHTERAAAGLVRCGISLHRRRERVQSSAQGKERCGAPAAQRRGRHRLRPRAVPHGGENGLRPTPQDPPQLHPSAFRPETR